MNEAIDVVIPWVDGSDKGWQDQRNQYISEIQYPEVSTAGYRFRSWDNLQYIFRGIEKFMPWVNRVFLITWGHIPPFLNREYERLVVIKHEDYIPQKYLPTFNTNTIEMNLHRIEGLSENFILFNDDLFPLQRIEEEYYFDNNEVCDQAVQTIVVPSPNSVSVYQCQYLNNIRIINKHFDKREVIACNKEKWFCKAYTKEDIEHNNNLSYWNYFTGFRAHHMAQSYKKSTFKEIWDRENKLLDMASRNKFRFYSDITEYVVRYWQLCEGRFKPRKALGKTLTLRDNEIDEICEFIELKKDIMICIEDVDYPDKDFKVARRRINESLNKILPDKSLFEI